MNFGKKKTPKQVVSILTVTFLMMVPRKKNIQNIKAGTLFLNWNISLCHLEKFFFFLNCVTKGLLPFGKQHNCLFGNDRKIYLFCA